ncbi:hypothetical protein BJQ94_08150 [Cryobacterium sp. SO2]|uniref:hypothetical protein n=1 Tax=Cryobacterium sp. SO2 TaxID=1897060 RepID=UPI00223CA6F2|nr:hypothetical protein [Cryobacterium sp. SO2]WEO78994.1 hypothetical protein BJQ94_08150 [Cryobacterium sp. SO2]
MEAKRFRLEGTSLSELQARVRAEHGDTARIVAAEQVTVGGIRGFFARRHVEVTVEVQVVDVHTPESVSPQRRRAAHARSELSTRLGIAALLDAADETEAQLAGQAAPAAPGSAPGTVAGTAAGTAAPRPAPQDVPSTASPDFARLMDELTFATSPAPAAPTISATPAAPTGATGGAGALPDSAMLPAEVPPALTAGHPGLLTGSGDLVLLIGPPSDVVEAARLMSAGHAAQLLSGRERPGDRRAALAARARGVQSGRSVLVACPLPDRRDGAALSALTATMSSALVALGADQVWVVVDAGRKPADTARWVRDVGASLTIDAVAVLGVDGTATPGTVRELGLPIGWLAPSARDSLGQLAGGLRGELAGELTGDAGREPAAGPAGPPNPIAIG